MMRLRETVKMAQLLKTRNEYLVNKLRDDTGHLTLVVYWLHWYMNLVENVTKDIASECRVN